MDYSINKTTMEQRKELVKKALGISISGSDIPTDETLALAKKYIEGKIELKELQEQVINKYNKNN
jgi:hypothetical protein